MTQKIEKFVKCNNIPYPALYAAQIGRGKNAKLYFLNRDYYHDEDEVGAPPKIKPGLPASVIGDWYDYCIDLKDFNRLVKELAK
jgi:hypothetical protein